MPSESRGTGVLVLAGVRLFDTLAKFSYMDCRFRVLRLECGRDTTVVFVGIL